ncbi:hypothetical protein LZ017_20130 [Pelomonas sp. CA6]|uniref:carboxypeptidase-like regulatory domain-containing protein n=1 Tax=Pelomonas sp. CA6 TaxID=2907999 RepID=UPI001F4C5227|nr:hypothetical protein [Pelomonas sp. CA6]MCH7345688.1 hypothetical protein [Pelomonas sp. CA6]
MSRIRTSPSSFQRSLLLAASAAAALAACGGGGSGSDTSTPTPPTNGGGGTAGTTLSGTAATGAPIAGTVSVIDVNGKTATAVATNPSTGAYTVDVTGLTAPYLLTVVGMSGGRQVMLSSVGTAAGQTVNLTPLTDLIVSAAAGVPGAGALVDSCTPVSGSVPAACLSTLTAATSGTRLKDALQQVSAMIAPLNKAGTDPLNGSFSANGQGLDGVLDRLVMTPANAGAPATLTLVASQTVIGQMNLPATAGQAGTVTSTPPSAPQVQLADAAATVVPEINTCLGALAALYPATGFKPPAAGQVSPFIADNFRLSTAGKAEVVGMLTSGAEIFVGGFNPRAVALAARDMSPLSAAEIAQLDSAGFEATLKARANGGAPVLLDGSGKPQAAWVMTQLEATGAWTEATQFVRGEAYAGCPAGWRWAGTQHLDMHMAARVTRNEDQAGALRRERAFHIERGEVADAVGAGLMADVDTAVVVGPGIVAYSGDPKAPMGDKLKLVLKRPSNALINTFVIRDGRAYYGDGEALQSCRDLAAQNPSPVAGTPCVDEAKVVPGAVYGWILKSSSSGNVVAAFPYEINAVPLSTGFAAANASNLFATIGSVTPDTVAGVKSAVTASANAVLDGVFSIGYTQGKAYGSTADNCNWRIFDANGAYLLSAEANAVGQQTRCSFATAGLNSGSLQRPADANAIAKVYVSVTTNALGNQLSTGRSLR